MLKMAIAEIRYNYIYFLVGHLISVGLFTAYILMETPGWDTIFRILGSLGAIPIYISFILKFTQKWETMAARIPVKPRVVAFTRLVPATLYLLGNALLLTLILLVIKPQHFGYEYLEHLIFLTGHLYLLMTLLLMLRDWLVHFKNIYVKSVLSFLAILVFLMVIFADRLYLLMRAIKLETFAEWYLVNIQQSFEISYLLTMIILATIFGMFLYSIRETYLEK